MKCLSESSLTVNKGITQINGNVVRSTRKKDYSFIQLTDKINVRAEGIFNHKKITNYLLSIGYSVVSEWLPNSKKEISTITFIKNV